MSTPKRAADDSFESMLALAQGDNAPETIYDDLRLSFNTTVQGSQEALSQRDEALAKADAEIQRLKALAFERMMNNENMPQDDEPKTEPDEPSGINSLFDMQTRYRR